MDLSILLFVASFSGRSFPTSVPKYVFSVRLLVGIAWICHTERARLVRYVYSVQEKKCRTTGEILRRDMVTTMFSDANSEA